MAKLKPVIQRDIKDCGICSMAYIISYYGGYIPLEKLREDTYTNSLGTTAYHIVTSFNKWGFDASGVLERDLFNIELFYPLIAHIKYQNIEHFVVVNKVNKKTIYLMDPSSGYKKMTLNEFQKIFSGYIILVKPRDNNIIKYNKELSISKLFLKILYKEKFLIIKIIIVNILFIIFSIITSYYLKIGSSVLREDYNLLKFIILFIFIITILKVICTFIENYYKNHLNNLVDLDIYPGFFSHLFNLPLKTIKGRTNGEILIRIQELNNIKNLFTDVFITIFLDLNLVVISAIVLYIINKDLFFILFIVIIIYILFGLFISKFIYKKVLKNINYNTEYNSVILENISMFESIKNLNITKKVLCKIENYLSKYLYNTYTFNNFYNLINLFKDMIIDLGLFLINSCGFISIYKGQLSIVNLFTFNLILAYFLEPIKNIITILPKYNYIKASFNKISEFLNIEEEKQTYSNLNIKGDIIFDNVCFSYNNYNNILNNLNFTIKEGEHILLEGESGIGKSTICKLLYKSYNPSKGDIYIGDNNIKDLSIQDIRNNILYVSQNEQLFTGTIRENIIAYRNILEEDFKNICKLCLIDDIIQNKSMRYESLIEQDAKNISGGEAQRIILARGLLKPCNIIILDEALSEVDKKLENTIIKNLKNYFKKQTIIYISHKNHSSSFKHKILIGEENV